MVQVMISSYKDLRVWQEARMLVKRIYAVAELLPAKERRCLADQLCRSVVSVPSNIAEGASRQSTKEYVKFVNYAYASLMECGTQLILCMDLGYIDAETHQRLEKDIEKIAKMLNALTSSLKQRMKDAGMGESEVSGYLHQPLDASHKSPTSSHQTQHYA